MMLQEASVAWAELHSELAARLYSAFIRNATPSSHEIVVLVGYGDDRALHLGGELYLASQA